MALIPGEFLRPLDSNGDVVPGALMTVYDAGTTTEVNTFSDAAQSSVNSIPIVADANGQFAQIFLPSGTYKIKITDPDGANLPGSPWDDIPTGSGSGTGVATIAAAEGTVIYPQLRVYVRGHTTEGDGGGAWYQYSASEPAHAQKFQDGGGYWFGIDERTYTPEQFGKFGGGSGDDLAAFQAMEETAAVTGTRRIRPTPGKTWVISDTWTITTDYLDVDFGLPGAEAGPSGPSDNAGWSCLRASDDFAGTNMVEIGSNTSPASASATSIIGVRFGGVYLNGNGTAAGGLKVMRATKSVFHDIAAEQCTGFGLTFDGLWLCDVMRTFVRWCGGGEVWDGSTRKCTNCNAYGGAQISCPGTRLWLKCADSFTLAPSDLKFFGYAVEGASFDDLATDELDPCLKIDATGGYVLFQGCVFNQSGSITATNPNTAPPVQIGSSGYSTGIDVTMIACQFKWPWGANRGMIELEENASRVILLSVRNAATGNARLIDVDNAPDNSVIRVSYDISLGDIAGASATAGMAKLLPESGRIVSYQNVDRDRIYMAPESGLQHWQLGLHNASSGAFEGALTFGDAGGNRLLKVTTGFDFRVDPKGDPAVGETEGMIHVCDGTGTAPYNVVGLYVYINSTRYRLDMTAAP